MLEWSVLYEDITILCTCKNWLRENIDKYTIIDGFNSQLSLIDMIGKISEIIEKSW